MILNPPTNYSGSKSKIMDQLLMYFPKDVDTFYDVFAGGLSVSMNTNYNNTIANDIISPLIEFYKNLQKASRTGSVDDEISKILDHKINKESQEEYNSVRSKFNETLDPYLFFAVVCSSTNNMMRFNKSFKYNQTFGKRTINDNTIKKIRDYCSVLKDKNIKFTSHHFSNFFQIYLSKITNKDFVYLDPPYFDISEAGYNSLWGSKEELYLLDTIDHMDQSGIRFALSGVSIHKNKNNPNIDRLSKYKVIDLNHNYEKVARNKNIGNTQEILVINY